VGILELPRRKNEALADQLHRGNDAEQMMMVDPFSTKHFLGSQDGDLCTLIYYLVLPLGKEPFVVEIKDYANFYNPPEQKRLTEDEIANIEVRGRRLGGMVTSKLEELRFSKHD
jgi:hypothetical protein